MNVHDLLTRSNAICKQYDRYLETTKVDPQIEKRQKNMDAFELQHDQLEMRVIALEEQAAANTKLRDRSQLAEKNALVRRAKAALQADIEALGAAVPKMKGGKDAAAARLAEVDALASRTDEVADGMNTVRKKPGAAVKRGGIFGTAKGPAQHVHVEMEDMKQLSNNPSYYESTAENREFDQEFQARKARQDGVLDDIEAGLGNLQNIAKDMGNEMQKQDILVDEIDTNMDKATKNVATNNAKLAGMLKKVGGQRSFCINLILICVLLAVVAFIYTQVS